MGGMWEPTFVWSPRFLAGHQGEIMIKINRIVRLGGPWNIKLTG